MNTSSNTSESSLPDALEAFDPGLSHFARLGVPVAVALDREQLEDNYLQASKRCHPDRFVTASSGAQRLAMEHAAALNEAYAVLRQRTARAEYLVKLGGIDLDSSEPGQGAPQPTQVFLIDMIERREGLDDARSEGREALEDARDEVQDEREVHLRAAMRALEEAKVMEAAQALVAARYLARLLEEFEAAVEAAP